MNGDVPFEWEPVAFDGRHNWQFEGHFTLKGARSPETAI
jgi:hypothetical protein